MTAESVLPFPGNRTLAGWWRQFAPLRPQTLQVGHFLVQSIEVSARVAHATPLDRLTRLLLEAVQSNTPLEPRLGLPASILSSLLFTLRRTGLLNGSDRPQLSPDGQEALASGRLNLLEEERRIFPYLALPAQEKPLYVPFATQIRLPAWEEVLTPEVALSPTRTVRESLNESEEWKREQSFPQDVLEILDPGSSTQRVPIIRGERLTCLILAVPQGSGEIRLHLYPVRSETWSIPTLDPTLVLTPEDLPLATSQDWSAAWLEWCRTRNVLCPETEQAELHFTGHQLDITLSEAIPDVILKQFQEWLKSDLWLLAGSERVRQAAMMSIRFQ